VLDDVRVSVKFLEFRLLSELGRELEELYGMVIFLCGGKRDSMISNSCTPNVRDSVERVEAGLLISWHHEAPSLGRYRRSPSSVLPASV
jgi:hypothetical protein